MLAFVFNFFTGYFQFFSPNFLRFWNTSSCSRTEYCLHISLLLQKRYSLFSPLLEQSPGNKNKSLGVINRNHQYSSTFPPHKDPVHFSIIIGAFSTHMFLQFFYKLFFNMIHSMFYFWHNHSSFLNPIKSARPNDPSLHS